MENCVKDLNAMYELKYSRAAMLDVKAIFSYIAVDSREAASGYLQRLESQFLKLREFPRLGHESLYPELAALNIRILPFQKYLIFYTVNDAEQTVLIYRVLQSSRNYRNIF